MLNKVIAKLINHTSLSMSIQERNPKKVPIQCPQQPALANQKQDPQASSQSTPSKQPSKCEEAHTPWQRNSGTPCP